MGIIIQQSIKNSIISYFGIVLGFITTIKLFPNILTEDEFGLTRVMIAIVTLASQFVNFGLPNTIVKFYPELKDIVAKPNTLFWLFSLPPLFVFVIVGVFFIFFKPTLVNIFSDNNILFEHYYYLLIPLLFSVSAFGLVTSILKSNYNTVLPSFLQDVCLRIVTMVSLFLFFFKWITFKEFMLLFICNYLLQYLILFIYALTKKFIIFDFPCKIIDKNLLKKLCTYSIYSFFGGITMILVGNIDLIMVSTFEGLSKTSIYSIAIYIGSVIAIPRKSIAKITLPVLAESFKRNDFANIKLIYRETSLNLLLLGLLIFIGIVANINNIYAFMPEAYSKGIFVIIALGCAYLFNMSTGANGQIIITSSFYRFDFYSSVVLILLTIGLNLLLIPRFGINGAAFATAISICVHNLIKLIYVWIKLKIQPFSINQIWLVLISIVILYSSFQIEELDNFYLDIIIRSISISFIYILAVRILNLSKRFNQIIDLLFARLLKL